MVRDWKKGRESVREIESQNWKKECASEQLRKKLYKNFDKRGGKRSREEKTGKFV